MEDMRLKASRTKTEYHMYNGDLYSNSNAYGENQNRVTAFTYLKTTLA